MSELPSFQIDVNFRNFKFTRGYAVKDTSDAMTEFLTNACDAYLNVDNYKNIDKYIYITFHHVSRNDGTYDDYLQIVDNATGVDPENMKKCFLAAGSKTSNSDMARGFFSTGAKNVTILGDVYYTSIIHDKYTQVYLDDQVNGYIVTHGPYDMNDLSVMPNVVPYDASDKLKDVLNISNCGLNVVLKFTNAAETNKFASLDIINNMLVSLQKNACLRDIFANPSYHIIVDILSKPPLFNLNNIDTYIKPVPMDDNFGGIYRKRLTYIYPTASLLLSTTFTVPNYPQYNASFVIYKSTTPIPQPVKENQMEFGFLIKDSYAIHEVNTLGINERYRWNPNINYIYGYVLCDGFCEELKKYDRGDTQELILDPNRVGGINHNHSLYTSIMTVCLPRLDKIMVDIQKETTFKSVNIQDLDGIVSKLEEMGIDVFKDNNITFNYVPDNQGQLAIAIKETQENIVSEISGSINANVVLPDNSILDKIKQIQNNSSINYLYYINKNGDLISHSVPANLSLSGMIDARDLQTVVDDIAGDINSATPYLFSMRDGELTTTQIYQKGRLEQPTDNEYPVQYRHKSLTIQFINDINYEQRYLIDTTNGIIIQINLHNKIVADKLINFKVDELDKTYVQTHDLTNNSSSDALQFLEMLIIDAFADIICNGNIGNGSIVIDDTSSASAIKLFDHWTQVCSRIEPIIHPVFVQFINQKKANLQMDINNIINFSRSQILDHYTNTSSNIQDIENSLTQLAYVLNSTFYNAGIVVPQ